MGFVQEIRNGNWPVLNVRLNLSHALLSILCGRFSDGRCRDPRELLLYVLTFDVSYHIIYVLECDDPLAGEQLR